MSRVRYSVRPQSRWRRNIRRAPLGVAESKAIVHRADLGTQQGFILVAIIPGELLAPGPLWWGGNGLSK